MAASETWWANKQPSVPFAGRSAGGAGIPMSAGVGRCPGPAAAASIRRRIAAVRGVADDLLERSTHRHVQIDVLGRDRLREPLVVDRVDLAAFVYGDHRTVDDLLEGRIVAPQHDGVGLD